MTPVNFAQYVKRLDSVLAEKLFFLSQINLDDKIVIDFGCGDGSMLQEIEHVYPNARLVGIDQEPKMLNLARRKVPKAEFYSGLDEFKANQSKYVGQPTVVIFSSVLHELYNDYHLYHVIPSAEEIPNYFLSFCDYVVVRDMYVEECYSPLIPEDICKILQKANPQQLAEFIHIYGSNFVHFLLKYNYTENWYNELMEDYASVPWHCFLNSERHNVVYDHIYVQNWRRNLVMKDFGIDLKRVTLGTHRAMILEPKEK